jgi:hypothetical protein
MASCTALGPGLPPRSPSLQAMLVLVLSFMTFCARYRALILVFGRLNSALVSVANALADADQCSSFESALRAAIAAITNGENAMIMDTRFVPDTFFFTPAR